MHRRSHALAHRVTFAASWLAGAALLSAACTSHPGAPGEGSGRVAHDQTRAGSDQQDAPPQPPAPSSCERAVALLRTPDVTGIRSGDATELRGLLDAVDSAESASALVTRIQELRGGVRELAPALVARLAYAPVEQAEPLLTALALVDPEAALGEGVRMLASDSEPHRVVGATALARLGAPGLEALVLALSSAPGPEGATPIEQALGDIQRFPIAAREVLFGTGCPCLSSSPATWCFGAARSIGYGNPGWLRELATSLPAYSLVAAEVASMLDPAVEEAWAGLALAALPAERDSVAEAFGRIDAAGGGDFLARVGIALLADPELAEREARSVGSSLVARGPLLAGFRSEIEAAISTSRGPALVYLVAALETAGVRELSLPIAERLRETAGSERRQVAELARLLLAAGGRADLATSGAGEELPERFREAVVAFAASDPRSALGLLGSGGLAPVTGVVALTAWAGGREATLAAALAENGELAEWQGTAVRALGAALGPAGAPVWASLAGTELAPVATLPEARFAARFASDNEVRALLDRGLREAGAPARRALLALARMRRIEIAPADLLAMISEPATAQQWEIAELSVRTRAALALVAQSREIDSAIASGLLDAVLAARLESWPGRAGFAELGSVLDALVERTCAANRQP